MSWRARESAVRIAVVHPDLLGTYGDGGNALVLAQRLKWRGVGHEVIEAHSARSVPATCDIYCLGGGEDGPQSESAALLRQSGSLTRAVDAGAVVLAVCAGFQNIGEHFAGADGKPRPGIGILEMKSEKTTRPRAVGEVVSEPAGETGLATLTGYENHGSVTTLGSSLGPLGRVVRGVGNGAGQNDEGAFRGRVVGTYLHGPVLARNPALADLLLTWVVGELAPLDEDVDHEVAELRAQRLSGSATRIRPGTRFLSWRKRPA